MQPVAAQIVRVDPRDVKQFAQWHAVYEAGERASGGQWAVPYRLEELLAEVTAEQSHTVIELYAVHEEVGSNVRATSILQIPQLDNRQVVRLGLDVHPDHWGRGMGRQMLAHAESRARSLGRTVMHIEAMFPQDAPRDGRGTRAGEFLARAGYGLALGDVMRVLDLPADGGMLDRLLASAADHHRDYRLLSFSGPTPEDLLPGVARLSAELATEAPTGELDIEPESADLDAYRDKEQMMADQGRTKFTTVAVDRAGEVAAYSEILVSSHDQGRAYQWGTLVHPAHRCHRLGTAVKAANLRALQAAKGGRLDVHKLITFNAEVNAHMLAINEAMGFRPVARLGEFQKRLTDKKDAAQEKSPR